MKKLITLTCGAALLSACASIPAPKRFAGDRASAPIHSLSVAVLLPRMMELQFKDASLKDISTQGQNAMANKIGGCNFTSAMRLFLSSIYEPERFYRGTLQVYYQDFKNVTLVQSIDDPRVASADLIAVPDVTYSINPPSIATVMLTCFLPPDIGELIIPIATKLQVRISSVFYAPDHSLVATIKAASSVVKIRRPAVFPPKLDTPFNDLHLGAASDLDAALENSPELTQYAKSLASKRIAQAEPARQTKAAAQVFDSDVDRPGYGLEENPRDYAVVIGVENYQNLPAAEFARRDAETVRAHLRALGYPGQNIALLTDAQATGNKIKSYVESWLPRNIKPDSKVFLYFSGHGAPDPETKQAYLMPWDADAQYVADTGYPLKHLYQQLNNLPAKQIVVAMDSCFSGAGGRSVLANGTRPLVSKVDTGGAADLGKLLVLAAADAEEITGTAPGQGHGLFTYYLLKALNEQAGQASVGQVYSYLKPKVAEAARRTSRSQTPLLLGEAPDQAVLR